MKARKFCQSCGMPIRKDPKLGGTNADGTKSLLYCSYCYENGAFTQPDFTLEEMRAFCIKNLKEQGVPGFFARWMTSRLPKLERWRSLKVV